ncbi:ribulokinase [Serratia sp. S1B]|nr:ribulokinase [Serratia sp. S1B]
MNTQNVKTAAHESSERYFQKRNLKPSQIYDLFLFVKNAAGKSTGTSEPPSVPANAERLVMDMGDFDSLAVWIVDGWPVAASDEMILTHWDVSKGQLE